MNYENLEKMIYQQTNEQILDIISNYIKTNPNMKFMEILYQLGIIPILCKVTDLYFENPNETLQRMNKMKENNYIS